MDPAAITFGIVPAVILILGIIQAAKQAGLVKAKAAGLAAIGLGATIGAITGAFEMSTAVGVWDGLLLGSYAGLAASGLYSTVKNTADPTMIELHGQVIEDEAD